MYLDKLSVCDLPLVRCWLPFSLPSTASMGRAKCGALAQTECASKTCRHHGSLSLYSVLTLTGLFHECDT